MPDEEVVAEMSTIYIALAGIMPLMAYFGAGSVLVLAMLAAAWFSPVFKKEFLWAGLVVAAFMTAFTIGVYQGEQRVRAQWNAAEQETIKGANEARKSAERSVARKPSRWMPNRRDAYDRDAK
jgi:cobalamin biosynthesis protein CobD/CbiB